jgi:hypothetical protein
MEIQRPEFTVIGIGEDVLERMDLAAANVRKRQAQILHALKESNVRFALSGSNAVFAWIASVDEAATRQYRNVEFIVQREDVDQVVSAMEDLGLTIEFKQDRLVIRSEPDQRERWADCALFAAERLVNAECIVPNVSSAVIVGTLPVLSLDALVKLQLSRWTLDDRVDLRDMMDVGLLDQTWPRRLPPELGARLQELLDDPNG